MPTSSPPPAAGPPSTTLLRAAVALVLILTLAATGLWVMAALATGGSRPVPTLFAPAAVTLAGGIALAAVIEGLARLAGRPTATPVSVPADPATGPALERLVAAVTELRIALPELVPPPATPAPAESAEPVGVPPESPMPVDAAVSHLDRIVHLLEELKELALLDESQRQARGQMTKERRKAGRVEEAVLLIQRREWEQADALLTLLESLYPGDPDVLARRNELDDARSARRDADWSQLVRQVEDLSALHRYDEAGAVVAEFREAHPAHTDAAGLAVQLSMDGQAHADAASTALFAEIKTAVDARQWRMALDGAQRFLGRFPEHPRADRIRQQVRTIQRNAELEERHEQETRIKELAQAGQFAEAADLCEDLLGRFPDSPQVPALQNLLPKLRERSTLADASSADGASAEEASADAASPFNG